MILIRQEQSEFFQLESVRGYLRRKATILTSTSEKHKKIIDSQKTVVWNRDDVSRSFEVAEYTCKITIGNETLVFKTDTMSKLRHPQMLVQYRPPNDYRWYETHVFEPGFSYYQPDGFDCIMVHYDADPKILKVWLVPILPVDRGKLHDTFFHIE
jgi:hypothetical protein